MPLPPSKKLTTAEVYDSKGKPKIDVLKQHFVAEGRLSDECALRIIQEGTALLRAEKTMLDIDAPVTGTFSVHIVAAVPLLSKGGHADQIITSCCALSNLKRLW